MQPPTNLSPAEQRLRSAVAKDQPVRFKGRARRLPADVIRALCVEKIEAKRISISGATIVGVLNLEGLALNFPLRLKRCILNERPIFSGTRLHLLDLCGSHCVKGIDAAYIEVATNLILSTGFRAKGDVRLYRAKIHGDLDCTGGHFADRHEPTSGRPVLDLEGATIDGSAFLRRDFTANGSQPRRFEANGGVRLLRAKIGGDLDCSGGRFTSGGYNPALSAVGVDIAGCAFLRAGFSAHGEVSLYEAKIGGTLDCGDGSFINPGANAVNATGARVGGFLTWFKVSTSGRIILERASVNQLADEDESWPACGNLFLDGFEYREFAYNAPRDAKARLDWLKRQSEFTPQPYDHLISVLQRSGHEGEARKVAIEKQMRSLPWTSRAWNRFFGFNTPRRTLAYARSEPAIALNFSAAC